MGILLKYFQFQNLIHVSQTKIKDRAIICVVSGLYLIKIMLYSIVTLPRNAICYIYFHLASKFSLRLR